jgi:hypothetical protein
MTHPAPVLRVNRAPVLTLWAAVVAERLGHPPETALALGRFVAGSSARAKARRLGITDEDQDAKERRARAADLKPRRGAVRLLGRAVPVTRAEEGTLGWTTAASQRSRSVRSSLARALRAAGEGPRRDGESGFLAPPEELNRVGFRLYERFRPEVPEGAQGWAQRAS